MSHMFHKSCYTSRSSGYKYRTHSTNTGERTRRDSKEDSTVDKVFRDMRREIFNRIDREIDSSSLLRRKILDRFEKIDAKISGMLELQDNVLAMRQTLNNAESTLRLMAEKVQRLEEYSDREPARPRNPHRLRSPTIRSEAIEKRPEDTVVGL